MERADSPTESCGNLDVDQLILGNDAFFPFDFDEIRGDPLKRYVYVCMSDVLSKLQRFASFDHIHGWFSKLWSSADLGVRVSSTLTFSSSGPLDNYKSRPPKTYLNETSCRQSLFSRRCSMSSKDITRGGSTSLLSSATLERELTQED